jgi:Tol biopolymer transport system component
MARLLQVTLAVVVYGLGVRGTAIAATSPVENVAISSTGALAADSTRWSSISADGSEVVFYSTANNLVSADTNATADVFIRRRYSNTTERVSLTADGTQANGNSYNPRISANGKVVAFISTSNNIVAGDTNNAADVFVRDLEAGTTERVSVSTAGVPANVFSVDCALSADGRYVAFSSAATNLDPLDTSNDIDVFVHDRVLRTTRLVSFLATGSNTFQATRPSISADGARVAFSAANLGVYVREMSAASAQRVDVTSGGVLGNGSAGLAAISSDGQYVVFSSYASNLVANDLNAESDVFRRDLATGEIALVSVFPGASAMDRSEAPTLSSDGRYVAFSSRVQNPALGTQSYFDVFVRDMQTGSVSALSRMSDGSLADGANLSPMISDNGSFVVFESLATNLFPGTRNTHYKIGVVQNPDHRGVLTESELLTYLREACGEFVGLNCDQQQRSCLEASLLSLSLLDQLELSLGFKVLGYCQSGVPQSEIDGAYQRGFDAGAASVDRQQIYDAGFAAGVASIDTTTLFNQGYQQGFEQGVASVDVAGIRSQAFAEGVASVPVDAIRSEAYGQGFDAGHLQGFSLGYSDGHAAGYDLGYSAGHSAGYDAGYSAGFDQGELSCPVSKKIQLCHRSHERDSKRGHGRWEVRYETIEVNRHALWVHLLHGDTLGACATGQ